MGEGALGDCAEAERTKRIRHPPVEMARGTDLRLALPESTTPLRLRTLTADHRSTHLRCHDPPHDTAARRRLTLFKLPLKELDSQAGVTLWHAVAPAVLHAPSAVYLTCFQIKPNFYT